MKITLDKFRVTLLGISLLTSFSYNAQTSPINLSNTRDGESVEYCVTHKNLQALRNVPGFSAQFAIDQANMAQVEQNMRNNPTHTRVIYKIPVVFHILHNDGVENISTEQVLDAVRILNRDYRLQNTDALNVHNDFKASNPNATCIPADIEVEFVLATKAPNGNCFSGITRTKSALTSVTGSNQGGSQVNAIVSGNDVFNGQWPGNKYLNVFVASRIGGAAGYTMYPNNGPWGGGTTMNNGIWILHNYLGSIGTSSPNTSRALTHEVGHWLNLSHTWGDNNDPGVACDDDHVADTPETQGVTSCNLNENSCGPRANVENYMDYSYCSKMFSEGQRDRMRAALVSTVGGRNNIWTASNLTAVGADGTTYLCQAKFNVNKQVVCLGEEVRFTDASYNEATGWIWSFPGGVPSTSTDQNPTVVYNTPGTYTVTLTATDGITSDVETRTAFITVAPTSTSLPFFEGFESYSQTSDINTFSIYNSATNAAWGLTNTAGSSGSKSIKLGNFSQTGINVDELTSIPIDLSNITNSSGVTLSFRYAYRKKTTANSETLKVSLTADCGDTWQQRRTITGTSLSAMASSVDWTPTASDWVTIHMTNVTSQYWVDKFKFKFTFDGSGGNNVFLDDINIYVGPPSNTIVLGIEENTQVVEGLNVYPNPSEGELNVSFNMNSAKEMTFVVTDLLGKTIQNQKIHAATGSNLVLLSTESLAKGMYLLQIGDESNKQVVQFLVK